MFPYFSRAWQKQLIHPPAGAVGPAMPGGLLEASLCGSWEILPFQNFPFDLHQHKNLTFREMEFKEH